MTEDGLHTQGSAWDTGPNSRTAGTPARGLHHLAKPLPGKYTACICKQTTKITSKV